jgi:tetratricopeptide (TPR) repeat protein
MHKLQSIWILGLVCLILACGNRQKESQYASMPKELAEIYRKIDKNPRNANLYFELSDYYMSIGRLDSALNIAFSAIRLDSANSTFYVKLSDIYFAMANAEMAEETLEKAIVLDKKNNEAYLKLGELYYLLENYAQAEEILIKAIHLQTHNQKAYHLLGRSSREKGDTTMAIRHYLKSVEQKSDYFETYEELALLYHNRRDPLAIDFYNNALNAQPNQAQTLQTLYNMAMFYQETGSYEKALEKYRMMLQIEPKNKYALHNMGWIYLVGEDKYEEAVVFFTKAIEQDSTYVEAVFNRGLSFEYLKQYDNARQDYMYSLHLVNNYPKALEKLNHLDKLQKR